jgi:flagellar hook-basal body complex protein FliE
MNIEKKGIAPVIMFVSMLFLICYCAKTDVNIDVYGQVSQYAPDNNTNRGNSGNLTDIQNISNSNTNNVIPYVLNLTNGSDTKSQVVNQVIQAMSGGQSTSLQQVLDAASKGNASSSSLEQVIDEASSALNNSSMINGTNSTTNATSGLP